MSRFRAGRFLRRALLAACGLFLPALAFAQSPNVIWQESKDSDRINTLNFTPNGSVLISGSSDRLVNIWNASNGALLKTLDSDAPDVHADSIECMAINPANTNQISTVSSNLERVWNISAGTDTILSPSSQNWNVWCAFSPDGSLLATASFNAQIRVWDLANNPATLRTFPTNGLGTADLQRTCAFSPDGKWLASAGGDNVVTVRATSNWAVVATMEGDTDDIYDMQFSPDSTMLATGSYDQTARIWNVGAWTLKYTFGNGQSGNVYAVAFSPDSQTLAYSCGESNALVLANTATGSILQTYNEGITNVQCLAFSRQGTLAYGDVNETVFVANVGIVSPASPTVTITSPSSGNSFTAPATIPLSATAASSNGVARVQYFDQNNDSLGSSTSPPFSVSWSGVAPGSYTITAVMTDDSGDTATSGPVSVTVNNASGDSGSLKVAITSPASGARFLEQNITLDGTASANAAAVLVSLNGQQPVTASGTTKWSAGLTLQPGPNTVQVQSEDTSSNLSAVVTRTYTYILSSPLTVLTNGAGRVLPGRGTTLLIVGDKYTIEAVPAAGNVFNGWTDGNGNLVTNLAAFTFAMQDGMTLQANFVPNPFPAVDGPYQGLIDSTPATAEGKGRITIAVAAGGTFTAGFDFDFASYSLSGRFLGDGSFSKTIPRGKKTSLDLSLLLDVSNGTDQVTGSIFDGTVTSSITANRLTWNSRTNPAPAGHYTLLIQPDTGQTGPPQGYGYALVSVNSAGGVVASGRLADGEVFSETTFLSKDLAWPFFVWGGGTDSASGFITIEDQTTSDMDGILTWFRQANAHVAYFADGFSSTNSAVGSVYLAPPAGSSALTVISSATDNATVSLGAADFTSPLPFSGTLNDRFQFVPDKSTGSPRDFAMTLSRNGIIAGSFVDPNSGKLASFFGVVYQDQNYAAGFFLQDQQSGYITLAPSQ